MQFLRAKEEDKSAIMELWAQDFESYEPYFSWYFNTIYRPERTYMLKENEALAACAQLAPYKMSMRGQAMDINFVVGVITQPELRGKGLGAELMTKLSEVQKDAGLPFSVLVAVCPEFYAKLGYCHCYAENVWNVPISRLRVQGEFSGLWQEMQVDEALSPILQIYEQMTMPLNGYIIRSEENLRNFLTELVNDNGKILIYKESEIPKAYMLYFPKEGQIFVREIGCAEGQYQNACFQYAKDNFSADTEFNWSAPEFNTSYLQLPMQDGIARKAGAMIRCHNALQALELLSPAADCSFSLQITDKWERENNINILFTSEGGKVKLQHIADPAEISMDILSFTQLYCGFMSVADLALNGRLQGSANALKQLERCFPKQYNWLSEQT